MKWFRVLQALMKGPDTLDAHDIGAYAARRLLLRSLIAVVVAPVVLFALIGVPWIQGMWAKTYSPCGSLLDEAAWAKTSLPALTAGEVTHHDRMCRIKWTFDGAPPGTLTLELAEADYPLYIPKGPLQSWDWERSETVRSLKNTHEQFFHVVLRDHRQLTVTVQTDAETSLAPFVTQTIGRIPKEAFRRRD